MYHIISTFLESLTLLLPIVNPLGTSPIFYSLTSATTSKFRAILARRIAIYGLIIMVVCMLFGSQILNALGLTIAPVRIAGGLILIAVGWNLLHQNNASNKNEKHLSDEILRKRTFSPLTLPITTGPGTIAVTLAFGAKVADSKDFLLEEYIGALLGISVVAISIYLCYRFVDRLMSALGEVGSEVIVSLSAFILLCISVQIICSGYSAL
ncbi:MAG: NAAT family transporter [Rhodospirillaceae bacterium]|nr:NAAT family transporter [Rhodospirillaceae bacterium]